MKIKYQKMIISDVNPDTFIRIVLTELVKSGYTIKTQTQNQLEFKYNIWKFGSRIEAFGKIDGGCFNFNSEKKK